MICGEDLAVLRHKWPRAHFGRSLSCRQKASERAVDPHVGSDGPCRPEARCRGWSGSDGWRFPSPRSARPIHQGGLRSPCRLGLPRHRPVFRHQHNRRRPPTRQTSRSPSRRRQSRRPQEPHRRRPPSPSRPSVPLKRRPLSLPGRLPARQQRRPKWGR